MHLLLVNKSTWMKSLVDMKKIMDEHGKNHPDVKQFMITSSGDVENRGRMYGILAKKHGGKTNVDFDGDVDYTIPNPHHKKET